MSFSLDDIELGTGVIDEALGIIHNEHLNMIYCSLTGIEVGLLSDVEIRRCLKVEQMRKPLATSDELADSFVLQYLAYSSKPAPSLRVHRDHNTMVRVLKADASGPSMLLGYLSGKLLFDSMVQARDVHSSENSLAKLSFLREFQARVQQLPKGWQKSLTARDEESNTADRASEMLRVIGGTEHTAESEGKSAQRCLETLLRLDAIHDLRAALYDTKLRTDFGLFRESDNWTFRSFHALLARLESDSIIRLRKTKNKPEGNAMMLTAAIESISWSSKRMDRGMDNYIRQFENAESKGKFATGTSGSAMMQMIRVALAEQGPNGPTDVQKSQLEKVLTALDNNMNEVSWSDGRLSGLKHYFGLQQNFGGNTKVRRGDSVVESLAKSYTSLGKALPEPLRQKLEVIQNAKAAKAASQGKKTKPKKVRNARENAIASFLDTLPDLNFKKPE